MVVVYYWYSYSGSVLLAQLFWSCITDTVIVVVYYVHSYGCSVLLAALWW